MKFMYIPFNFVAVADTFELTVNDYNHTVDD